MIVHLTGTPAAVLAVVEISILSLAGYVVFRRWEYTFAESWAYALMAVLMTFSFLFQLSVFSGLSHVFFIVDWGLTLWSLFVLWRMRSILWEGFRIASRFMRSHLVVSGALSFTLLYLALLAYSIPPEVRHWDLLSRALLVFRGDAWPAAAGVATDCVTERHVPLNTLVLSHLFLRHHTDLGIGLIGLMAYLCIGFSTYALSRRYVWPPTAIAVTLVVMSMPRFVLLATSPGFEILPAAVALFCILAAYRVIESPNMTDLAFLIWGILFSIHAFSVYLAVPAIMLPLFGILLFRRHGFHVWWITVKHHRRQFALALLPALVFSQVGTIGWARAFCDVWIGNPSVLAVVYNPDGIQGTVANMGRYLLQSAHFTQPVDWLLHRATGFSISRSLEWLHAVTIHRLFGESGAVTPFQITWLADESTSWYGPLALFLVLPAVLYAARRAPRRLKAITVALAGYFFLIALALAWQPDNVRYFDFFFVCGGFCTAFFLTPWRISARGRRSLLTIAAMLMLYATAFNHSKPLLSIEALSPRQTGLDSQSDLTHRSSAWQRMLAGSIWSQTQFGRDRAVWASRLFGDDRVEQISGLVPQGAPLWVVAQTVAHAYPFLLGHASAKFLPARQFDREAVANQISEAAPVYLLFVDLGMPDPVGTSTVDTLWRARPVSGCCDGRLVRLK